jgi:hypothetical protein
MKRKLLFSALMLLFFTACRQSSNTEVAPEQPGGPTTKAPTSKVLLTYTGEIKDGDWIEIDELARMFHRLDTSDAVRLPGEPAQFTTRDNVPMFYPVIDLQNLWTAHYYFRSRMSGSWVKANTLEPGLPPLSLALYLNDFAEKGRLYGVGKDPNRPYWLGFEGLAAADWQSISENLSWNAAQLAPNGQRYGRYAKLIIERTDGQPIRIRTSEGYAAKIEYQ